VSSINPAPTPQYVPPPPGPAPSGGNGKIWTLFALVAALIAGNVYSFMQLNSVKTDLTKTRDELANEISKVQEANTLSAQSHRQTVERLRDQLEVSRRQAAMAAGQAKIDAIKRSEELAAQLAREQQKAQAQTNAAISQVKEVATTATNKIGEVSTEVGTVKTDVAQTKSDLEKTIANLKRVTGDLSSQGSLIATNSTELNALRQLGERNYFEFRIAKSKQPQRVGDISVQLKKADVKKNRYTIELIVDDQRVEKKDKTINEPVQFLTSKAKQPYEIVVNKVQKDLIAGYLATPKVQNVRN
jgi:chromosome segregation ATPase